MSKIQNLEQEFLRCWEVSQDIDLLVEEYEHDDDLCNKLLGIKNVYDMRFSKAWQSYEALIAEHYSWKQRDICFDLDEYPDNTKDR
jgi:hypothetical protein